MLKYCSLFLWEVYEKYCSQYIVVDLRAGNLPVVEVETSVRMTGAGLRSVSDYPQQEGGHTRPEQYTR